MTNQPTATGDNRNPSPRLVCRRCGVPVDLFRGTWRHLLNGATGGFPPSMRHKAEPRDAAELEPTASELAAIRAAITRAPYQAPALEEAPHA